MNNQEKIKAFTGLLRGASWRAVGWRDVDQILELGVLDSHYAFKDLDLFEKKEFKLWLDVGSGNGLNAIPLALMFPDWKGVFVEKNFKKADWLKETLNFLDMHYEVLNFDVRKMVDKPDRYDVITARALFPPNIAFKILSPLLNKNGFLILFCGKDASVASNKKFKIMTHDYEINAFGENRKLIIAIKL